MPNILIVDDDLSMREFLELMLSKAGYQVQTVADGQSALNLVRRQPFDLIITDIRMKKVDGLAVLRGVKAVSPDTVVILISAFATVETAVTGMKEGAHDFIPKPFNVDELKSVIKTALAHRTPEAERQVLQKKVKEGCHFGSLVGQSPEMLRVYDLVRRAAMTNTNIVITGESGTGKELAAKAIHENSPRAAEKFVAINCGGMPEQLIESELFGYKKGAFTGASADKPGLFELAHNGTIFLDEIAELTVPMQVKLLRVVQDKTFRPVGSTQEHKLDVRFIAATNKDLEEEVMAGRFREDLYFRLNVINIHLPPLRERKADIPLLAQYFLEKYSRTMNKNVRKLSVFALDLLGKYDFPGNVRELENIVERSVALEQSNIVLPESLTLASFKRQLRQGDTVTDAPAPKLPETVTPQPSVFTMDSPKSGTNLDDKLAAIELRLLLNALSVCQGHRQRAADQLGVSLRNLSYRLAKYGLAYLTASQISDRLKQLDNGTPDGPNIPPPDSLDDRLDLEQALVQAERYFIEQALAETGGSKTRAAALLGVTFRSFRYRLSRFEDMA